MDASSRSETVISEVEVSEACRWTYFTRLYGLQRNVCNYITTPLLSFSFLTFSDKQYVRQRTHLMRTMEREKQTIKFGGSTQMVCCQPCKKDRAGGGRQKNQTCEGASKRTTVGRRRIRPGDRSAGSAAHSESTHPWQFPLSKISSLTSSLPGI